MTFNQTIQSRRSIREYTGESLTEEQIEELTECALYSATGRGKRPWELYVVSDKEKLQQLSLCRKNSALMLKKAACAIIVAGDSQLSDTWIEDCSIVMTHLHLKATEMGLGSCWIQSRGRKDDSDTITTSQYIKKLLNIPENLEVEAVLSVGCSAKQAEPYKKENLHREKIHRI